ncbi:hypothetical protein P5V15_001679 [Pogonomyrmex californicus]
MRKYLSRRTNKNDRSRFQMSRSRFMRERNLFGILRKRRSLYLFCLTEEGENKYSLENVVRDYLSSACGTVRIDRPREHQFLDARYYARVRGRLSTNFNAFGVAF